MRFILVNQYYPPDPAPTGQVLHDLALCLRGRGHAVRVLCSQRSYGGKVRYGAAMDLEGVALKRLPAWGFGRRNLAGRLLDYASFYLLAAFHLCFRGPRPDVIICLSTPPFLGLLARAAAAWRGCLQVHWVMDLYPEALAAHGLMGRGSPAYRMLEALNRAQFAKADLVLTLGSQMAKKLRPHLGLRPRPRRLVHVPLWPPSTLPGQPQPGRLRAERGWLDERLVLMYSGNMGLGHRFDEFLEAAKLLGPQGPLWAYCGGGSRRAELEAFALRHPQSRLRFLEGVPRAQVFESLASADVLLASLQPAWQGLMLPSKIQGIFASGRPLLFLGPGKSEIAEWIRDSGGGWVAEPGELPGLLKALEQASDPRERERRGRAASAFARKFFDKETNTARIAGMIESLKPSPVLRRSHA